MAVRVGHRRGDGRSQARTSAPRSRAVLLGGHGPRDVTLRQRGQEEVLRRGEVRFDLDPPGERGLVAERGHRHRVGARTQEQLEVPGRVGRRRERPGAAGGLDRGARDRVGTDRVGDVARERASRSHERDSGRGVDPAVAEHVVRIAVLVAAAAVVGDVQGGRADGVGGRGDVADERSAERTSASVPAVCGAAIEVPLNDS